MAWSEIYVDPSIAGDSGAGTIGDPFGDLEYAIEQTTFDATNGTRVNIKAGTNEIIAAGLNVAMADTGTTIAWVPTELKRAVFQGYTATAGDGGIGGITGSGTIAVLAGTLSFVSFIDMHLTNSGTANTITAGNDIHIIGCEIDTCANRAISCGGRVLVDSCYLHTITGSYGILITSNPVISNCYVDCDTTSAGINFAGGLAYRNIVVQANVNGTGILNNTDGGQIIGNSVYMSNAAPVGTGIFITSGTSAMVCSNNLVEGASGAGGIGINIDATSGQCGIVEGNAVYDCTTAYSVPGRAAGRSLDNETLTASPFTSAATGDFSPVDTGNVKEGALPQIIGGGLV